MTPDVQLALFLQQETDEDSAQDSPDNMGSPEIILSPTKPPISQGNGAASNTGQGRDHQHPSKAGMRQPNGLSFKRTPLKSVSLSAFYAGDAPASAQPPTSTRSEDGERRYAASMACANAPS